MLYLQSYAFAEYYAALEWSAAVVALIILVSCLDDLFIDVYYWVREAYRSLTVKRTYKPLSLEQVVAKPEQYLAIMIPAWMESEVIAMMLETMVSTLTYRSYVIFVGTYPNDAATITEVDRVARRIKRVRRVDVGHPGPTCKADCLNAIVSDIFAYEKEAGIEFAGVVMHDSEDVLHPNELHLFNYLFPRMDMMQLPVISLERDWFELVAGTYMDEFAECHTKDMVVRESLGKIVPSAGVGTAFSRRAIVALCKETDNEPFNTDTLTEDYDIGLRLGRLGMKSIFLKFPVRYSVRRLSFLGRERNVELSIPLCVREFFPNRVRTAYRQKARWILGISLQNWRQMGWIGPLTFRYLLFRDRKALVTSLVTIATYLILFQFAFFEALKLAGVQLVVFPSLFMGSSFWVGVLWFNSLALVFRVTQRFYFVSRIYGVEQGVLSIPRLIVGNAVNFMATVRAWKLFVQSLLFGTRVSWDKTQHVFPSSDELLMTRQRLGELLRSWQVLDDDRLEQALTLQQQTGAPLGRVLMAQGWLDDETLAEALVSQSGLGRCALAGEDVETHGGMAELDLCIRARAVPIGHGPDGRPRLAVSRPLNDRELTDFAGHLGARPVQLIAREGEITEALRRLVQKVRSFDIPPESAPLLGDILVERGLVKHGELEQAMQDYHADRDGSIGQYLVARGVAVPEAITQALDVQRTWKRRGLGR